MKGSRPAAAQDSIEELVRRAADRDTAAFARIVRLHNEDMMRVAFVVLGDAAAAEDATEAAWFDAWTGLRRMRTPGALNSWLCSLAAVEATGLANRRDAGGATGLELDDRPTERPAVPDAGLPTDDVLVSALMRLDPEDRAVLALDHVAGLSADELDQAMRRSKPPAAIRRTRIEAAMGGLVPAGSDPAERHQLLGQRLRDYASAPIRHVDADATARRARAEESFERTRVISVAISIVVGALVAVHPYLAALVFRR